MQAWTAYLDDSRLHTFHGPFLPPPLPFLPFAFIPSFLLPIVKTEICGLSIAASVSDSLNYYYYFFYYYYYYKTKDLTGTIT